MAPRPEGSAEVADATSAARKGNSTLAGFAGERFAVFDTQEHAVVFDQATHRSFGVFGHPVPSAPSLSMDLWAQSGMSAGRPTPRIAASVDGHTMLAKTGTGIQAVDLGNRGALLAAWRGTARSATIAPDGVAFVALGEDFVDLVRVADGAHVRSPYRSANGTPPLVSWTPTHVAYWSDDDGAHIIDGANASDAPAGFQALHVAMPKAFVTASEDAKSFALYTPGTRGAPGVIELWRLGETKARARFVSAFVAQVTFDRDASHVAWAEHAQAEEDDAPTFFHTFDVATGVHARFAAKGPPCEIAPESIVGFEDGALKTDAECSPGCPSIPSQAEYITYDVSTGRRLRAWSGELQAPYNDDLAKTVTQVEQLARRLGLARAADDAGFAMRHHPTDPTVLVRTESGFAWVTDTDGIPTARLEGAASFAFDGFHVAPDGLHVAAISDAGVLAVWNREGTRLWSSR